MAAQDHRGHHARPTAGTTAPPIEDLPPEALDYLLFAKRSEKVEVRYRHERGENSYLATFEGIVTNLERRYRETDSEYIRTELEKYMVERPCPTCGGPAAQAGGARRDRRRAAHRGRRRPCR